MTVGQEQPAPPAARDDERLGFHEAAHAVAMWKLGFGIKSVTIDPDEHTWASTNRARSYDLYSVDDPHIRRFMVEQNVMVLHAGSVAEQLLWPGSTETAASLDHKHVHEEMNQVEDDGSTQITWCNYLWQRTYTLLAWPGQWKLIVALARMLLTHRTLDGRSVESYLTRVEDVLEHDPSMPNAVLLGEVTYACSPWHRTWHARAVETTLQSKRTNLPDAVENMDPPEFRQLKSVLPPLSARAERCLRLADVRSVMDLSFWSARALASIRGAGRLTVQEIVDAAAAAGVQMASDDAPWPWKVDPERWR